MMFSKIKREVMDLFGEISVPEIMGNENVREVIRDISNDLEEVSISSIYHKGEREL